MIKTLWIPALPSYFGTSMPLYALNIKRSVEALSPPDIRADSTHPITETLPPREGSKAERFLGKYLLLPWQVSRAKDYDILHVLDNFFTDALKWAPASPKKVVTLHDLAPLTHEGVVTPKQKERYRRVVRRLHDVDLVLAVSRITKESAMDLLNLDPEKIEVLHNGVDYDFFSEPRPVPEQLRQFEDKFRIISIGYDSPRKNLKILPEVLRNLRESHPDTCLIRVGGPLRESLREDLKTILGPENLVELGKVDNATAAAAFQYSHVLLYPSVLEGFGLPILEAMAAGTPVACSDIDVLREVAGDLPFYFDPHDPGTVADALLRIVKLDEEAENQIIREGREHARQKSWKHTAEKLVGFYRSLAG
jgi:glycosyltransferase involved in cell wall biosynthesis